MKAQIENKFTLTLSYNFSPYMTNNNCKDFLIPRYFISYELFLKIACLSIHGHFALIKVKNPKQSSTFSNPATKTLFHKKVFFKTMKQFVQK